MHSLSYHKRAVTITLVARRCQMLGYKYRRAGAALLEGPGGEAHVPARRVTSVSAQAQPPSLPASAKFSEFSTKNNHAPGRDSRAAQC